MFSQQTHDLAAAGGKFSTRFLFWQRPLDPDSAARKAEKGEPFTLHTGDHSWKVENPQDLLEMHVFFADGSPEQLSDKPLAKVLKGDVLPRLLARSENGVSPSDYAVYNVLSGQWKGNVTRWEVPFTREDALAKGFFQGAIGKEALARPERAEAVNKLISSPYPVSQSPASLYASDLEFRFGKKVVPNEVLDRPEEVERVLDDLRWVKETGQELFGECEADRLLTGSLWNGFDREEFRELMVRSGPEHLPNLLGYAQGVPDEKEVESYFQVAQACGGEAVHPHVVKWVEQGDERRLKLLEQCQEVAGAPAWVLAERLAGSRNAEEDLRFAKQLEGYQVLPSLDSVKGHRELFLEVRREARADGLRLPLHGLWERKVNRAGPDLLERYEALHQAELPAYTALYAALAGPGVQVADAVRLAPAAPCSGEKLEEYAKALQSLSA